MKRALSGPLALFAAGLCLAVAFSVVNAARYQGLATAPLALAVLGTGCALAIVSDRKRSASAWGLFAAVMGLAVFGWAVSEVGRSNLGQLPGAVPTFVLAVGCASSLVAARPSVPVPTIATVVVLTLAVAYFSGGKGGASPFVQWLLDRGLDPQTAEVVVVATRKSVHVAFYGCLALAATSALRAVAASPYAHRWPAATLAWVAGFATFDEARQSMSAGRNAQPLDVAIDLAGAALFILAADRTLRRRRPD
ncbi:MAG: VanZ family protein [Fimbriimonadaceae bacterium]|nr:VanZ family protein [Fimbriimonadaceae bacterium]